MVPLRRPVPVRNNLDVQRGSDRDLAEQARLLGGIDSRPRDLNVHFEGDNNVSRGETGEIESATVFV